MSLTIDEVFNLKAKSESAIALILAEFSKATSLRLVGVDVRFSDVATLGSNRAISVPTTVSIQVEL